MVEVQCVVNIRSAKEHEELLHINGDIFHTASALIKTCFTRQMPEYIAADPTFEYEVAL